MKLIKYRKKSIGKRAAFAVTIFAVFACAVWSLQSGMQYVKQQQVEVTESAVRKALVTCYAIEGVYPSDLSYLEEHYGVQIDHSRLAVEYQAIAPNVLPSVTVVPKGGSAQGGNHAD
jgi:hypothetical protein